MGMKIADQVVFAGDTTDTTGSSAVCSPNGEGRIATLYLTPGGTLNAGKVQFETAEDKTFTGTWAPLGSEVTLSTGVQAIVTVEGVFKHLRARITTNLGGTTPSLKARIVVN